MTKSIDYGEVLYKTGSGYEFRYYNGNVDVFDKQGTYIFGIQRADLSEVIDALLAAEVVANRRYKIG